MTRSLARQPVTAALCVGLFAILASAGNIHSSPKISPDPDPSQKITAVLTMQQTAWNQGDIPAFMKGYWNSPELTFSGSSGVSRGFDAVLARYQRNYANPSVMGHLDFSDLEIHSLGDSAAMVLGKWHLTRTSGDVGGVFTLVFQRFPDGWRIIHDHTSSVEPKRP